MKILNQTTRESYSTILKTPVTDLQPTSEFDDKSYLHLVQFIDDNDNVEKYESMKIRGYDFKQKVYEAVQNTFKTEYWDTHCNHTEEDAEDNATHRDNVEEDPNSPDFPEGTSFKELIDYLGEYDQTKNNKIWQPTQKNYRNMSFIDHIYYDFDVVKRYAVKRCNNLQSQIDVIDSSLVEIGSMFSTNMKIYTTDKDGTPVDVATTNNLNVDDTYCQMEIKPGNKISNTWTVPASGNLVVYGWLDSSDALNNRAIPSSFCVLEADINPTATASGTDEISNWEIISAQPVIPFKTKTYVGFNVPVRKGLVIRARTGFLCGAKSGQTSNEQDGYDTIANSTPNGFKCIVYSHMDYDANKSSAIENESE